MLEQATAPIRIALLPKQDDFVFSDAKYTGFIAGLGSGKTYAGCIRALLKCHDGQDGMVVAPTFPMMRDVTLNTFLELLRSGGYEEGRHYDYNKSEFSVVFNGSKVLFRSADAPERLRGVNLNWAYLDEAAQMHDEVWRIILGRLRQGYKPCAWITTTPKGRNWVWHYWIEKDDPDYRMVHARTGDNTFLDPAYLRSLQGNYVGEYAKQEIEGEFVSFEGLVYSEFSRNVHVYEDCPLPDSWPRVRAIDFGYTNPFVCLWGAIDPDGRLYVYDEHYRAHTLVKEHAALINSRNHHYAWTVADHDAQEIAELRDSGVYATNARKDVLAGLQRVKSRLVVQPDGYPRLFVSSRCVNVIKEFELYRWQDSKDDRNDKEEPLKQNDHAMDALRYMVMQMDAPSGVAQVSAAALGL